MQKPINKSLINNGQEIMPKFEYEHHAPRSVNKQRKNTVSEEVQANRRSRINFKNYLRQVEEELIDDENFEDDETYY